MLLSFSSLLFELVGGGAGAGHQCLADFCMTSVGCKNPYNKKNTLVNYKENYFSYYQLILN